MHYEITLQTYQGPLDKLLELVEARQLEIAQISLAAVTGDFLKYIEGLGTAEEENGTGDVEPTLLADFLVVASKLILIKSKTLIPSLALTEEESSDIRNLEFQLKLLQELKKPKEYLKKSWSLFPRMGTREFLAGLGPVFYPPNNLGRDDFVGTLEKLLTILEKTLKPVATIRVEVLSLKKKIEEIFKRLGAEPTSFQKLKNTGTRGEVVVMFLAILHLIKEQLVFVNQAEHFDEINIVKKQ